MINSNTIIIAGIAVIIIGFILVFVGTALQASSKTGEVKSGGVILIGPIPIIFGNDKSFTIIAVIMAIIIMVVSYILFYRGMV